MSNQKTKPVKKTAAEKGANNKPYTKKKKTPYDPNKSKNFCKKQTDSLTDVKRTVASSKPIKVTKKKMSVTKFQLVTSNFESGMTNILNNLPKEIENLLRGSEHSHFEMTRKIVDVLSGKVPNFETRENVLWEFKISANKVSVKTDKYCGFGWTVKSIKNAYNWFSTEYTFTVSVYGDNFEMETKLASAGFKKVENK